MGQLNGRILKVLASYPNEVKCVVEHEQDHKSQIVCVKGIRIIEERQQISSIVNQIIGRKIKAVILKNNKDQSKVLTVRIVDYL